MNSPLSPAAKGNSPNRIEIFMFRSAAQLEKSRRNISISSWREKQKLSVNVIGVKTDKPQNVLS